MSWPLVVSLLFLTPLISSRVAICWRIQKLRRARWKRRFQLLHLTIIYSSSSRKISFMSRSTSQVNQMNLNSSRNSLTTTISRWSNVCSSDAEMTKATSTVSSKKASMTKFTRLGWTQAPKLMIQKRRSMQSAFGIAQLRSYWSWKLTLSARITCSCSMQSSVSSLLKTLRKK